MHFHPKQHYHVPTIYFNSYQKVRRCNQSQKLLFFRSFVYFGNICWFSELMNILWIHIIFFELLMMHMSHILVFRMILKVHLSLEQKRILIVDNFLKKIKVSRQLNWHKVPLNLDKIFVVSTKLLTSPADLLRESEHKLHLVGKFIFEL